MGNANGTGMLQVGAMIGVELVNSGPQVGGGQLQGKVYLQVDKEKVSALSLVLRFIGLEKVCVTYTEESGSGDDRTTTTHSAYANHDIVRIEATLAQFPSGEVTKGRYEFPFVLNVPPNLPGTQGQAVGSDYFVIQYTIGAELIRPASMLNAKVANGTEIFIMDPPAIGPPVPSTVSPHIVPVSFCCCYSTGQMQLTANVDSTCPAMGESFNVSFGVENMSSSKVKGVEVMLMQITRGIAQGHSFSAPSVLFQARFPGTEVPGSEKKRGGQSYQSVASQASASPLKTVVANVPLCRPTLKGVNGGVSHMLIVKACTPACTVNPVIEIPMRIHASRAMFQNMVPAVEVPFQRPADWQAQAMATPVGSVMSVTPPAPTGPEAAYFAGGSPAVAAASPVPGLDVHSVQYLIQQLQSANQFLEVSVVRDWLAQGGRVDDFTPDMLQQVFGCLRQEMSYSSLTEDVGAAMRGKLSLYHVAGAARGCPESQRSSVCIGFAKYVQDKSFARSVLSDTGLSQSALDMVLMYY
eukprot:gene30727-37127_t